MNYKQYLKIKEKEAENKAKILKVCPGVPDTSGIYILTREENGFKYAYIGQAKHLLSRLAQHLTGFQHIDLSIKKHGLYSEEKPFGWKIRWESYPVGELDIAEQIYIKNYANRGYQLRNHTSGSQSEGKRGLGDQKSPKGYYDGLAQGYKNAQKEVAHLFDKHLNYSKKSEKPNKLQEKALEKFKAFLNWENSAE